MTTCSGSGYEGFFKNQQDEGLLQLLDYLSHFPPLQEGGCWPGMLGQKVGSVIAARLLAVSCLRHHPTVSLVHFLASISSQLRHLQDLSHFRDLSSSQELHILLFGPPSFFPRPLLSSTPYFLARQDSLFPSPNSYVHQHKA